MHILQIPGIIFLADARRSGLRGGFCLQPGGQFVGSAYGCIHCGYQFGIFLYAGTVEYFFEVCTLRTNIPDTGYPKVAGISGEVHFCLLVQRRNDAQVTQEPFAFLCAERKFIRPDFCSHMVRWAFVCGHIAARRPERFVKCRIAHPGLQNAVVEVIAVHFCPDDVPVHLLRNRPTGRVYCL